MSYSLVTFNIFTSVESNIRRWEFNFKWLWLFQKLLYQKVRLFRKFLHSTLIVNNLFQYKRHLAWIIINNLLHKINHHIKKPYFVAGPKICDGKKKTLVPGAVCVALPLLASHSRSLRRHCSTPFLFIRSNYNLAVPILVRRGSTILFMTAGLSVQLTVRAPSPSL